MNYFQNAKVGDKVFGLVQGHMKISNILPLKYRVDGFAAITCQNNEGEEFYYTMNGLPAWALNICNCRTLYYTHDISFEELDTRQNKKILSEKKVLKGIELGNIQFRVPSGIWIDVDSIPWGMVEKAISKSHWHLFRTRPKG